ncbi:hypothetical protein DM49_2253 [Burkholderia mallei]|nr:hypothetical protein DM46_1601 [Burkholderia mallei]KOS82101.1 hypothetical protein DM45_560 [Burkholderia mallei]KOS95807.1 hypothetical protein DM49_2253 [Burkholderia mallei]
MSVVHDGQHVSTVNRDLHGQCQCRRSSPIMRVIANFAVDGRRHSGRGARQRFLKCMIQPLIRLPARKSAGRTSIGGLGLDDETGRFPFGKAVLETGGLEASGTQGSHCLECKYTVRAAAIRHDFRVGRELAQAGLQRGQRDIERARQMPLCELVMWAHVQQGDQTVRKTRGQLISRHWLHRIARMEIVAENSVDLGDIALPKSPKSLHQPHHFAIAGQPVHDVLAAPLRVDEPRPPKNLQVSRRVRKAHA